MCVSFNGRNDIRKDEAYYMFKEFSYSRLPLIMFSLIPFTHTRVYTNAFYSISRCNNNTKKRDFRMNRSLENHVADLRVVFFFDIRKLALDCRYFHSFISF